MKKITKRKEDIFQKVGRTRKNGKQSQKWGKIIKNWEKI